MIAIGIPTYNEAENIAVLTKKIDDFACELGQTLLIINSDNDSLDKTSDIFKSVKTKNKKIALHTSGKGKGKNIKRILEYVKEHHIDYCLFVDGDVTSLEKSWLEKHIHMAQSGFDYVVPEYTRYLQEGNTTNHFAYPVLNYLTNRKSPKQPIAGDFGLSDKFAEHLLSIDWSPSSLRYGIDIFITMHALSKAFKTVEVSLGKKIHNPSFGKMVDIFTDEAIVYFECREALDFNDTIFTSGQENVQFISGSPISNDRLALREKEARTLFSKNVNPYRELPQTLTAGEWAETLVSHEQMVGKYDPEKIAKSLCPFFLIRVISYLREAKDSEHAEGIITEQTELIYNEYARANI